MGAAAQEIINSNDFGGLAPFVSGPRALALVQTEGGTPVAYIADSKNDAELRTLEAYRPLVDCLAWLKRPVG